MATLKRPDGVEIHWEASGEGPLLVVAPNWASHPSVYAPLIAELDRDHRVVRYDARGTGESTRQGPYDIETSADDLAALLDAANEPAVLFGLVDAHNACLHATAARPELVRGVIGAQMVMPMGVRMMGEIDTPISSEAVLEAGLEFLENDYRSFLRAALPAGNRQMSEKEIRERVSEQVAYCDQESALGRMRSFASDEPLEQARALGDRLWILYLLEGMEPLFPPAEKVMPLTRELLPEAHVEVLEEGIVSRPDLTATRIREIVGERAPHDSSL
jgi:pimeloyl-ACP methyl ester carboxylesterase